MKTGGGLTLLFILILSSCSGEKPKTDSLEAHTAMEKVQEQWKQVEKPLEVEISGRSKEELEAIGSIGVWFPSIKNANDGNNAPIEFHFDGEVFKPLTPVFADSTVIPCLSFPYIKGLMPNDTIRVVHPIGQRMVGINPQLTQNNDKISVKMELKDVTALLRIRLQSNDIADKLGSISLFGDCIMCVGLYMPYKGLWNEVRGTSELCVTMTDCMLNNGWPHDFNLIPNENAGDVEIAIVVGGKSYSVSTTLPPLRAGSITELRLNLNKGRLTVGSSWVDTKHPFEMPIKASVDSVRLCQFLQKDGTIKSTADANSVGMVVKTDGKHGVAVGLKDSEAGKFFSKSSFNTGKVFATVDGFVSEGCYKASASDSASTAISFIPSVKYNDKCAFSMTDGVKASGNMLGLLSDANRKGFHQSAIYPMAYLPSLFELASLSSFMHAKGEAIPIEFQNLNGFYMSCCESGDNTFYSINPETCRITGYNSKEYHNTKTRLFYLF